MASNEMISGSLADWKTVLARRETWRLKWLQWKVAQRTGLEGADTVGRVRLVRLFGQHRV